MHRPMAERNNSHQSVPIDARDEAATAFAQSVQRHGILLTETEILRQYDRYNASKSLDAATQQVLGRLLDTLESRRAATDAYSEIPATVDP